MSIEEKISRIMRRLEFLGDAVLELGVSRFLYSTEPDMSEGELTKLRAAIVCEPSLVKFSNELGFGQLYPSWERRGTNGWTDAPCTSG